MGMAVTFDTLKFVETLKASGFDETQAKGLAVAIREVQAVQLEDVAVKRDLKELEGQLSTKADVAKVEIHVLELKRDIKELEAKIETRLKELDAKIETAKADTFKWAAGMFAAQTGIIIAAMFAVIRINTPPPVPVYQAPMEMSAPVVQSPRQAPPAVPVQPGR